MYAKKSYCTFMGIIKGRGVMIVAIVQHYLNKKGQQVFPEWISQVEQKLSSFDGFMGIEKIENVRFPEICCLMLQFDTTENLKKWSQSIDHGLLVNELTKYCLQPYRSQIFSIDEESTLHKNVA